MYTVYDNYFFFNYLNKIFYLLYIVSVCVCVCVCVLGMIDESDSCKHCRNISIQSSTQFICIQCTADVFPFNHYNDDTDFYWSLYMFIQLNQNVDLPKKKSKIVYKS